MSNGLSDTNKTLINIFNPVSLAAAAISIPFFVGGAAVNITRATSKIISKETVHQPEYADTLTTIGTCILGLGYAAGSAFAESADKAVEKNDNKKRIRELSSQSLSAVPTAQ